MSETPLPASRHADTRYDYTRPWQSNEERLTGEALSAAALGASPDDIRSIRPALPSVGFLPPRFGWGPPTYLTIGDVVNIDRASSRVDYSQSNSGYSGTSYPQQGIF